MYLHQEARLCKDYIQPLHEERKKILVFQRELPLCLNIITHAIETGKQRIGSEEETGMGETPVLEEFIPLKPAASSSGSENSKQAEDGKRPDWLRSVQLWSQEPDPKTIVPCKPIAVNAKKHGGAFRPFEKEKYVQTVDRSAPAASSTIDTVVVVDKEKEMEEQSESNRKARRCWSLELHRRFLHALQHLGGTHAATPKQIRELMKVDGLTNDEVKSHLQKYRLHTRRTIPTVQRSIDCAELRHNQMPMWPVLHSKKYTPQLAHCHKNVVQMNIHRKEAVNSVAKRDTSSSAGRSSQDGSSQEAMVQSTLLTLVPLPLVIPEFCLFTLVILLVLFVGRELHTTSTVTFM